MVSKLIVVLNEKYSTTPLMFVWLHELELGVLNPVYHMMSYMEVSYVLDPGGRVVLLQPAPRRAQLHRLGFHVRELQLHGAARLSCVPPTGR